ncbi:MAG: V-type ATP synthase subunit F [Lachnospiraceae bacterium]|nr:V-type ATP synthase subunit F [Lachnospiraceae bacterium]
MYKIAVMGEPDSIYGFAALGLDTFPFDSAEDAGQALRRLADSDYAVIYITEGLASLIAPEIERYQDSKIPAVIRIPGVSGNTGEGIMGVKKSVEQAVGSDILFGGEN